MIAGEDDRFFVVKSGKAAELSVFCLALVVVILCDSNWASKESSFYRLLHNSGLRKVVRNS